MDLGHHIYYWVNQFLEYPSVMGFKVDVEAPPKKPSLLNSLISRFRRRTYRQTLMGKALQELASRDHYIDDGFDFIGGGLFDGRRMDIARWSEQFYYVSEDWSSSFDGRPEPIKLGGRYYLIVRLVSRETPPPGLLTTDRQTSLLYHGQVYIECHDPSMNLNRLIHAEKGSPICGDGWIAVVSLFSDRAEASVFGDAGVQLEFPLLGYCPYKCNNYGLFENPEDWPYCISKPQK